MFHRVVGAASAVVVATVLLSFGCSSYEPAKHPERSALDDAEKEVLTARGGAVSIQLAPLFDSKSAHATLGIDPGKSKIMPAMVKVVNESNEPVKVEVENCYLSIDPNERWRTLNLKDAIDRGLRSDAEVVFWTVGFGLFAWAAAAENAATTNRTLEEDYYAKSFKPTLINAGGSGQGVIFFDVPRNETRHVSSAVIRVRPFGKEEFSDIRIAIDRDVLP